MKSLLEYFYHRIFYHTRIMDILLGGPLFKKLVKKKGYQNHLGRLGKTPLPPLKYGIIVSNLLHRRGNSHILEITPSYS